MWDTETGKAVSVINTETAVRTVNFDASGNILVLSTDARMGKPCTIRWFDLRAPEQLKSSTPYQVVSVDDSKVRRGRWARGFVVLIFFGIR